jgi:hypothetical protein
MAGYIPPGKERSSSMYIELQVKTDDAGDTCWDNSCNARYRVTSDEGGYVVVGKRIDDPAMRARLNLAESEEALWVPGPIIEQR